MMQAKRKLSRGRQLSCALATLCLLAAGPVQAQGQAQGQSQTSADAAQDMPPILQWDAAAWPEYDPARHGTSPQAQEYAAKIFKAWQTEAPSLALTRLQLEMFVKHKIAPTRGARGLALMHVAMHDAWQLARRDAQLSSAERRLALAAAAAQVLGYLFIAEEHHFERIVHQLRLLQNSPGAARALALGRGVGQALVQRAEGDGAARGWNGVRLQWYGEGRYYGPGTWEPTPPYFYYPPDEPFAPGWKTWVVADVSQLRPTPPAFGSEKWRKDLQEVLQIQKNLTPEQLKIAKFWVDGSGSVTPPGHWNQIALELALKYKLDDKQSLQLFALLNMTLADTFIAVWDTKYHYWTARPVTMVKTALGENMSTAILTPPFPSYVSGHAAFSGASARILGAFFAQEAPQLDAMAEEAAMSRLYGGIHYRHDNEDGLRLGRRVAEIVLQKAARQGR